jgi:large-conductance mechanosensitive channel
MSSSVFFRTIISGFIATFVMAMVAFILGGVGFPALDIGYILTESFNHSLPGSPYHIIFGNLAYNIGGILLALIWVAFLQQKIPGNWAIQGLIYGLVISVLAGVIISPFVALAAGEDFGLFYTNTWFPGKMIFAGLFMHLSYGLTLTLCLKVAGVEKSNA